MKYLVSIFVLAGLLVSGNAKATGNAAASNDDTGMSIIEPCGSIWHHESIADKIKLLNSYNVEQLEIATDVLFPKRKPGEEAPTKYQDRYCVLKWMVFTNEHLERDKDRISQIVTSTFCYDDPYCIMSLEKQKDNLAQAIEKGHENKIYSSIDRIREAVLVQRATREVLVKRDKNFPEICVEEKNCSYMSIQNYADKVFSSTLTELPNTEVVNHFVEMFINFDKDDIKKCSDYHYSCPFSSAARIIPDLFAAVDCHTLKDGYPYDPSDPLSLGIQFADVFTTKAEEAIKAKKENNVSLFHKRKLEMKNMLYECTALDDPGMLEKIKSEIKEVPADAE